MVYTYCYFHSNLITIYAKESVTDIMKHPVHVGSSKTWYKEKIAHKDHQAMRETFVATLNVQITLNVKILTLRVNN